MKNQVNPIPLKNQSSKSWETKPNPMLFWKPEFNCPEKTIFENPIPLNKTITWNLKQKNCLIWFPEKTKTKPWETQNPMTIEQNRQTIK